MNSKSGNSKSGNSKTGKGFTTTKDVLERLSVRPSKERGQNFLIEPWALEQILSFGKPKTGDRLVEIGPGLGVLTKELHHISPPLTVIEIEEAFCKNLQEQYPDMHVVHADVRSVVFDELGTDLTVFGNLPYSLSTDILFTLVSYRHCISRAVLLLQKEFVERMASPAGVKEYSPLSINCQLHAKVEMGPIIEGDCFHPPASVQSRVVSLDFKKAPAFDIQSPFDLQRLITASFFKRRKKILNSIAASGSFPGEDLEPVFQEAGIDGNRRAEMLSLQEFVDLSNAYAKLNPTQQ